MAQYNQPGGVGGWLPPTPPGQVPGVQPPPAPVGPPAPWPAALYYSYREPANDAAVAGFCLAMGTIVLLLFSAGIFFPLGLPMAIAGTVLSIRGHRRFKRGETRQHGGLARAGFWIGLVAILASIGAGVGWILAIVNGGVLKETPAEPNRQTPAIVRPR